MKKNILIALLFVGYFSNGQVVVGSGSLTTSTNQFAGGIGIQTYVYTLPAPAAKIAEEVFNEPEIALSKFTIYPNPSSTSITIAFSDDFSKKDYSLQIYNLTGMLVKEIKLEDRDTSVDVASLAEGVYLLNLMEEGSIIETKRLIKNN